MALRMPSPIKDRNGTYYLVRRVPRDLIDFVGKAVVKQSLGTKNPAEAKQRCIEALAALDTQWAGLRAGTKTLTERDAHALAQDIYDDVINQLRDNPGAPHYWMPQLYSQLWTRDVQRSRDETKEGSIRFEDMYIPAMRKLVWQRTDILLERHGLLVDNESRIKLSRACAAAIHRAAQTLKRLAEGYDEATELPARLQQTPKSDTSNKQAAAEFTSRGIDANSGQPLKLTVLVDEWWREAQAAGRKPSTYESYRNTVKQFVEFLRHDDATRVTAADIVGFKDFRLSTPSPKTGRVPSAKTVKDSDLSALKTLFGWAAANHKLAANPALGITIKLAKARKLRSKGFTDSEARAILSAALRYRQGDQERACTAAAKRWVPWLCAYTGARVGELAQLRRQDVRREGEFWIIHITPDAGTQKTNEARDVVLHHQLVDLGFPKFAQSCGEGHLFLIPGSGGDVLGPLQGLKNRLAEFVRLVVPDPNVAPNHGWRHRFKTVGLEAGIDGRVLDSIQGQAPRSVAEAYGEVTLRTQAMAIGKLPTFNMGEFLAEPA